MATKVLADYIRDGNLAVCVNEALRKMGIQKERDSEITEAELEKIDVLMASEKKIGDIRGIGYLKGLKKLLLARNDITEIPPELYTLTKLEKLVLSENKITALESDIGNLINLAYLDINENKLTELPIEMKNMTQLKYADVSSNELSMITPLEAIDSLEEINARNNPLQTINVGKLKRLRRLDISGGENATRSIYDSDDVIKALAYFKE